jgi:hypothetical protein
MNKIVVTLPTTQAISNEVIMLENDLYERCE